MPDNEVITEVSYTGIDYIESAQISFTDGISPSVATLTITPQETEIEDVPGTLRFRDNLGTDFQFEDCKVDVGSFEWTDAGRIWRLNILDRRWRWRFGSISGRYNIPLEDGTYLDGTEKTNEELITLLLTAMGETPHSYDVPAEPKVSVDWDGEVPAYALARLCDMLGCCIIPAINTNQVKICKIGTGNTLPEDTVMDYGSSIDNPEPPARVAILMAPNVYQMDIPLEAVGIDNDDARTIKPISQLTYAPLSQSETGGWEEITDIYSMEDIMGGVETEAANMTRELAASSVFRMYRICMPGSYNAKIYYGQENPADLNVPRYAGVVTRRRQILPLLNRQNVVETYAEDQEEGTLKLYRPPQIHGFFTSGNDAEFQNTVSTIQGSCHFFNIDRFMEQREFNINAQQFSFSIDASRGIVHFPEPVYHPLGGTITTRRNNPTEELNTPKHYPAFLFLRIAFCIRHKDTLSYPNEDDPYPPSRHIFVLSTGYDGEQTEYIPHPELGVAYTPSYNADGTIHHTDNNQTLMDEIAQKYLTQYLSQIQRPNASTIHYAGLKFIELDGTIRQVTWSIPGGAPVTTTASYNTEQPRVTIPYRLRRQLEKQRYQTTMDDLYRQDRIIHKQPAKLPDTTGLPGVSGL